MNAMEWAVASASSGGTGSRLTRVLIIISGVASLVATLLSIVYVGLLTAHIPGVLRSVC